MAASKKDMLNASAAMGKPGDNMRAALAGISEAAAAAGISRDVLIERIKAFADHPTNDQMRALQNAVILGYCAGRIARDAGRAVTAPEDMAAAASMLAKAGAGATGKKAKRSDAEDRIYGGARVFWHSCMVKADLAPTAGTGKGQSAGGKASAAKRKARTIGGSVDVTAARAPATKAPAAPTTRSDKPTSPIAAMAHIHAGAATLMAYVEANASMFSAVATKAIKASLGKIAAIKIPAQ